MDFLSSLHLNRETIGLLSIPFISAIIGWFTNLLAYKMIFWPVEFVGFRPLYLGWQGIVPKRIHIMAGKACDLITNKLVSVEEVFAKVEPEKVSAELQTVVEEMTPRLTDEIVGEIAPGLWNRVPSAMRGRIYARIIADAPHIVGAITDDLKRNITRVFDLKQVVVDALVRDKVVMNKVIIECAKPEFRFLVNSGLYLGFLCGFVQMGAWYLKETWWQLPLFGALVGYVTNWVALKLVFEPAQPKKILGMTIQGLFLRRQQEVALAYAQQVEAGVLNPTNILDGILRSKSGDTLFRIIHKHVAESIDRTAGIAKPFVEIVIGGAEFERVKRKVCDRLLAELPKHANVLEPYALRTFDIQNTLRSKMSALPPEEFVGVIRPAFQQDEWMLIVGGGVLGALVGILQVAVFFHF